jgi:mono/diheme cytochrome c family protein
MIRHTDFFIRKENMTTYFTRLLAAMAMLFTLGLGSAQADAQLEIRDGKEVRHYSLSQLLANPALRQIEVAEDATYHKPMRYQAVPLSAVLPQAGEWEAAQVTALDGFNATLPGALFHGKAQPWLALEPESAKWPAIKAGSPATPGPFYLVWVNPEAAGVSFEQWPYQIAAISRAQPLATRFPQLLPKTGTAAQRGLQVFTSNCIVCHRISGAGDSAVGPDLNQPHNPVEYFQESYLRKLVRQPASVRSWPGSIMPGFTAEQLSDAQLDDLLAYLKQMAKQK